MKKIEIVKKNTEFNDIIKNGKFLKNQFFVIYFLSHEEDYPKFGLAVSTKVGNAVVRNKLKRQLRMIIDNHKKLFSNSCKYIIMVRKGIVNLSYQEMNDSLCSLLERNRNEKN